MNDNRHLQEELSSINSFELLSTSIHVLKLTPESSGDLLFDFFAMSGGCDWWHEDYGQTT